MEALRQNARQVVDDARNNYISPYEEWSPDELRDLLAQYQIPIRDSANATHDMLVRICDTVFGSEIEVEPRSYTIEEVVMMDAASRVIQKAFFKRQAAKRQRQYQKQYQRFMGHGGDDESEYEYDPEEGQMELVDIDEVDQQSHYSDVRRNQSMLRRINQQGDDYDEEIEVEWRKPSWKFAKRFEAMNRPHRSGKQMAKYDWTRVTLGRHCYAGGCGEQLDLWNEGRTSEFSQFGSGITNYFKVW